MILVLASESPSRLKLLKQIGITPNRVMPANIDESPLKNECASDISLRLAKAKAAFIASQLQEDAIILAADTVSQARQSILPKAESNDLVRYCLNKLSGRRSRIYTSICIIKMQGPELTTRSKTILTTLKIKRLTNTEIDQYVDLGQGLNKAGGFAIEGLAAGFIEMINGSYSNIVGLPLFETRNLLLCFGFKF